MLLLVHKPVGVTSKDVLDRHRTPRIPWCHGGALDPFAEGLLILLGGEATKLFEHLHAVPKTYVADLAWGRETDNGDLLGHVVARGDPALATPERLAAALPAFLGWQDQIPPATSNKRVDGERAYVRAHRGETVVLPPSRVYLHHAEWVAHRPGASRLRIVCGGGYYVRSLARDLGQAVGARAHLTALRRVSIGPWVAPPRGVTTVTGRDLLPWMTSAEVERINQGKVLALPPLTPPIWTLPPGFPPVPTVRLFRGGRLVGLADPVPEGLLVRRTLGAGV